MAIPASVIRQGELADRLQKEAIEGKTPAKQKSAEAPADKDEVTATPGKPAVEVEKPAVVDDNYKDKYLVLKGKYDAEVPRLNSQSREQQESLNRLQAQVDKLTAAPSKPELEPEPEVFITEEQREEYGDRLVDFVQNASKEVLGKQILTMTARLDEMSKRVDGVVGQVDTVSQDQLTTTKENFWDGVLNVVPDYDAVNKNPDYLAWLRETDEMSGLSRQSLLEGAHSSFDVARFVKIMSLWKATQHEKPATETPGKKPVEETPFPEKGGGTPDLDDGEPPKLTKAFVNKFYKDLSLGKYQKNRQEAVRIEKQINEATAAGTII